MISIGYDNIIYNNNDNCYHRSITVRVAMPQRTRTQFELPASNRTRRSNSTLSSFNIYNAWKVKFRQRRIRVFTRIEFHNRILINTSAHVRVYCL